MNTFKAGDRVYFPLQTAKVCTLIERKYAEYPLTILLRSSGLGSCTASGEFYGKSSIQCIFHATQENRQLLEKLYGVEFETPPPKTVTIHFEMPVTFVPKLNEVYWYINTSADDGVERTTHTGTIFDRICIKKGVWRTKEEALIVAKAIFNIY